MPAPLLRLLSPKLWNWMERTLSALPQESHGRRFELARAQAAWGGRVTSVLTLALLVTAFVAVVVSIIVVAVLRPYVLELAAGIVLSAAWFLSPAGPDLTVSRSGVLFSALAAVSPVVVSAMVRIPLIFYGLLWLMVLFPARRAALAGVPVIEAVFE